MFQVIEEFKLIRGIEECEVDKYLDNLETFLVNMAEVKKVAGKSMVCNYNLRYVFLSSYYKQVW